MKSKDIVIVSATRLDSKNFYQNTPLGLSINVLRKSGVKFRMVLQHTNTTGLASIYNSIINAEFSDSIAVFIHDDVSIDDIAFIERLNEACMRYDIVGVVGNTRCTNKQLAWSFPEKIGVWDHEDHLFGRIYHHHHNKKILSFYGKPENQQFPNHHREVALIDGAFIAVDIGRLLTTKVRFDERFSFHHYDLDFCIEAFKAKLKIGVYPITITHHSSGNYSSPAWKKSALVFAQKHHPSYSQQKAAEQTTTKNSNQDTTNIEESL